MFLWMMLFNCCCTRKDKSSPPGSAKGQGLWMMISPRSRRSAMDELAGSMKASVLNELPLRALNGQIVGACRRPSIAVGKMRRLNRSGDRHRQDEPCHACNGPLKAHVAALLPRQPPSGRQSHASTSARRASGEERIKQMFANRCRRPRAIVFNDEVPH